ncbi:MAG: hypothetical protein BAJALOKI2v1_660020 [Promethearchaeota archaeon]|nr:MAG: hypothetical protein BAJALOKI2v1_660020 [Candidatus Lokiarchaeota archaeon]
MFLIRVRVVKKLLLKHPLYKIRILFHENYEKEEDSSSWSGMVWACSH